MKCIKCGRDIGQEAAFCPYCGEKVGEMTAMPKQPIYTADVKALTKSGKLVVYHDRVEFVTSNVQKTVYNYSALLSVKKGIDRISFVTEDGRTESCPVSRKNIHEAFLYIEKAARPYIDEHKSRLLAEGIHYSFVSSFGLTGGILNILADRTEFKSKSGQITRIPYETVRSVGTSLGMLEFSLTDGTSKSFTMDKDIREEVLSFMEKAVRPYAEHRTVGFDKAFGTEERIEINETRGVFHILRQGGNEITDEYPMESLVKCEQVEHLLSESMLGSVLIGGKSLFNSAAGAVGMQSAPDAEEKVSYIGMLLTIRTAQGTRTESVCFGSFSMGLSRSGKKYDSYVCEAAKLMDYLADSYPACELAIPAPPVSQSIPALPAKAALSCTENADGEGAAVAAAGGEKNAPMEKDHFGIRKYIEGITGLIDECGDSDSMTIAIQGSQDTGGNNIMGMLADSLQASGYHNLVWFHTRLFSQFDGGNQLPMLVGNRLISLLGGTGNTAGDRATKVAVGIINIISGCLSQGSSDGQNITEALFKDSAMDSLEKLIHIFSDLIRQKGGKVIFLADDMDQLAPAKQVELLDAMSGFLNCKGCVFAIAADYHSVISGAKEFFGPEYDEAKAANFFDKIFQMSFRAPVSGDNILHYVKDKMKQLGFSTEDGVEPGYYVDLIGHSIGYEPQGIDRLFHSFRLLKKLADGTVYADRDRRLILFALLCMQTKYRDMYDFLLRMRDRITPDFLSGLCDGRTKTPEFSHPNDDQRAEFDAFVKTFCDIINLDKRDGISNAECSVFAEVLDLSRVTSK